MPRAAQGATRGTAFEANGMPRLMAPGKRKATFKISDSRPSISPFSTSSSPRHDLFVACPTCGKSFSHARIRDHAWSCEVQPSPPAPPATRKPVTFIECPTCSKSFPSHAIEKHAWGCQLPTSGAEATRGVQAENRGSSQSRTKAPRVAEAANAEASMSRHDDRQTGESEAFTGNDTTMMRTMAERGGARIQHSSRELEGQTFGGLRASRQDAFQASLPARATIAGCRGSRTR